MRQTSMMPVEKRQRAAALQDADAFIQRPGIARSVLKCACPLALLPSVNMWRIRVHRFSMHPPHARKARNQESWVCSLSLCSLRSLWLVDCRFWDQRFNRQCCHPMVTKKEAEVFTSASLILDLNYRLPPYGLLNLKNICGDVETAFV